MNGVTEPNYKLEKLRGAQEAFAPPDGATIQIQDAPMSNLDGLRAMFS